MVWIRGKIMGWLINTANSMELGEVVQLIVRRYSKLLSDEEVVFISLPKYDAEERRRIISAILDIEENWGCHICKMSLSFRTGSNYMTGSAISRSELAVGLADPT